jgi:hypothetical protein
MLAFFNCISLCLLTLGTYFIWFNRKNILNHFFIGFCIIGYIIPSIVFDFSLYADKDIVQLYVLINSIGAVFYIIGLFVGNKWKSIPLINFAMKFSVMEAAIESSDFIPKVFKITKFFYVTSLLVMTACFVLMGYVPMFAADPYSAKQFKGVYQASYQHVAFFFRTSKQYIEMLMPFYLIEIYSSKKVLNILLVLAGLFLIVVTLNRSAMVKGIIWSSSIIISLKKGKKTFTVYLILLVVVFSLGSGLWALLGLLFPDSTLVRGNTGDNIAEAIALGSPDIADQLQLLSAYVRSHAGNTFGLTFIGGIIPYNFKWNPAVWTLTVLNDTNDISEIVSGGLRLPVTMWGYISFGWFGVAAIPFFAGFFHGYLIKKIRNVVNKLKPNFNGLVIFYYIVFLYLNIAIIFMNFYELSIYYLPAIVFHCLVMSVVMKSQKSKLAY